ncbi:ATP-grasp fold amidoligase family protein [Acinetobacter thermotolerans]|uniref:ATP-grasp fold amidoligase family protein n=1 Tax=Acinetobacter thermotolerans TaxID=3151487 RepID=UPI00325BB7AC
MYLNKNLTFLNETDAKEYALELVKSGMVQKDKWMVEELIQGEDIARDVKFYCFYGEIGLILESNRIPSLKRCWYDKDFSKVKTGKYNNNLFEGSGENLEELSKAAQRISLELPVPFIRLDFLQIGNDIYLGEFTPVPGGYAAFNQEWDKKLGEMYQHATVRISNDVAYGKIFDKYASLIKSEAEVIKIIKLLNS